MPEDKTKSRGSVTGNDKLEASGFAEARGDARKAPITMHEIVQEIRASASLPESLHSASETAESSMLHDIDAILSRLESGIVKERKAMDDLVARIRERAA